MARMKGRRWSRGTREEFVLNKSLPTSKQDQNLLDFNSIILVGVPSHHHMVWVHARLNSAL